MMLQKEGSGMNTSKVVLAVLVVVGLTLSASALIQVAPTEKPGPAMDRAGAGTPGYVIQGDTEGIADHVVINEVVADAIIEPNEEWVEIYNPTGSAVDISGWYLTDDPDYLAGGGEGSYQFPAGSTLPSLGVCVIANRGADFVNIYGIFPDFELFDTLPSVPNMIKISAGSIQLANTGDDVHLFNSGGTEIDAFWWGNGGDIGPTGAAPIAPQGQSLERSPGGEDSDDCSTGEIIIQTTPTPKITVPEMTAGTACVFVLCVLPAITFRRVRK